MRRFSRPAWVVIAADNVTCPGMGLHYARRGEGPPLVLIPGTSSDHHLWDSVIDRLARQRDVIALDVPGFGASEPLAGGERREPPALARAVAGLLDELGLERPHVAGHSLGGAIALEVARLGRARTVCAIAPIGFWTPRESAWCANTIMTIVRSAKFVPDALLRNPISRTALLGAISARPWRISGDDAVMLAAMPQPDVAAIVEAYAAYVVRDGEEIEACADRVTVAWGTRDALLFPREGRRVPRVLPAACLVWMKGLGHLTMWDDPAASAELLLDASAGSAA